MELDRDYPHEITSFREKQTQAHDLFSRSKKRKFADETKEQLSLQVSKHICCETLVEQSLQAKLIYAQIRKGKAPTEEDNDHTQTRQQDSTQDSNSTPGESFSHDESSEADFCSMDSTTVDGSGIDDELQGDGFRDDEFGHCLMYLGAACGSDTNNQQSDHEQDLEDLLYSNGVIPKFNQEIQLNTEKPTIDQEFEHYFSMLML